MRTNITALVFTLLTLTIAGCTERQSAETQGDPMTDTTQMQTDTTAMMNQGDQASEAAVVGVNSQQPYGQYLVDDQNMSLYMFKKDEQGANASTCYDACADAWPPLLTDGSPTAGASAVDSSMLGTFQRRDGSTQVTYNGWPLYYYAQDQQAGDVKGQDIMGFGAEWYLVSPEGTEVHGKEEGGS